MYTKTYYGQQSAVKSVKVYRICIKDSKKEGNKNVLPRAPVVVKRHVTRQYGSLGRPCRDIIGVCTKLVGVWDRWVPKMETMLERTISEEKPALTQLVL